MFTIREHVGALEGVVVTFVGDGNNVYHSLALLGAALGMEIRLAHPERTCPDVAKTRLPRQRVPTRIREYEVPIPDPIQTVAVATTERVDPIAFELLEHLFVSHMHSVHTRTL